MRLILGSASPRRKDLLAQIGVVPDAVLPPDINEDPKPRELPRPYCARLARENPSGLNYEALGMLQSFLGEPREGLKSLESAGGLYRNPAEAFRTVVERIRILQGLGDKKAALKLIDRTLQRTQPAERAKLLNDIRNEIAPPPPPPSPAKPTLGLRTAGTLPSK